MKPIYELHCELATNEGYVIKRSFLFDDVYEAQAFREYIKSLGGRIRHHTIDYIRDYNESVEAFQHEVVEWNRVTDFVPVDEVA